MLDGTGLFFDGQKPLNERITIDVADRELTVAMARIRNRIDTEIRVQNWQNLSDRSYENGDYALCKSGGGEGRYTSRDEGLTFDLSDDDFPTVLDIVKEEVLPLGYTHLVDSSDDTWFYVDLFNPEDGGYVHLTMAKGKGLIIQVNTGCRPWNRDEADTGE